MLSVADALSRVLALATPLDVETVPLADADGRVLARPVQARLTQPPFSSSAMDGYAVRNAGAQPGMTLKVIGESAAGQRFDGTLGAGEAVRIFTGAPVPEGADCVVIQEDVTREGDRITIRPERDPGPYIRPAGGDFREGAVFEAPCRLAPADLALLAAMNIAELPVYRKPKVALIATGDELVLPGETPGPDQIVASNGFGLKALLERAGAHVDMLPIARDTMDSLHAVFAMAEGSDLVVTMGGASVGDHDLVHRVLVERNATPDFYKVAMQPGKPLMAGRLGDMPMVGLPGNPVSTMVCGHVFLRPMLAAMQGFAPAPLARRKGVLGTDLGANGRREHYMRARLVEGDEGAVLTPFPRQDSALLSVLQRANALIVRPPEQGPLKAGASVEYLPLD